MKRLPKPLRALLAVLLYLLAAAVLLALTCNVLVLSKGKRLETTDEQLAKDKPLYDCILVPGALVRGETLSPILEDRMNKGLSLWEQGYAKVLLLSGDSLQPERYDEVGAMASYAMANGLTEDLLLQDGLGLSTYESLWRAKYVYGMQSVLIVTQRFHLARALYLADCLGLEATGVICDARMPALKNSVREAAARIKAVWDGSTLPTPQESN